MVPAAARTLSRSLHACAWAATAAVAVPAADVVALARDLPATDALRPVDDELRSADVPLVAAALVATTDARFHDRPARVVGRVFDAWLLAAHARSDGERGRHLRFCGVDATHALAQTAIPFDARRARTIRSALLAARLDAELTKAEIVDAYLQRASFGRGVRGVEAAALVYFGRGPRELDVAETALLVSRSQRPTSIVEDAQWAETRGRYVLSLLRQDGVIDDAAYAVAHARVPSAAHALVADAPAASTSTAAPTVAR